MHYLDIKSYWKSITQFITIILVNSWLTRDKTRKTKTSLQKQNSHIDPQRNNVFEILHLPTQLGKNKKNTTIYKNPSRDALAYSLFIHIQLHKQTIYNCKATQARFVF